MTSTRTGGINRAEFYTVLLRKANALLASTRDPISNMANIAALLYRSLVKEYGADSVNWCGFYIVRSAQYDKASDSDDDSSEENVLVLGPFHGEPAVTLIFPPNGVCGECYTKRAPQLVRDVHKHPNHIACDERSQSELVVPVLDASGRFVALIDIDAPVIEGFSDADASGVGAIAALMSGAIDWRMTVDTPIILKRDETSRQPSCSVHI